MRSSEASTWTITPQRAASVSNAGTWKVLQGAGLVAQTNGKRNWRVIGRGNRVRFLPATSPASASAAATTVTAAIAASSSTVAPTASGVLSFRAGLVYIEGASAHLRSVECGNGLFSVFVAGHFHKAEAARSSGIAVGHDANPIHLTERFKHLTQLVL